MDVFFLFVSSSPWNIAIQCLVLLRKIAGPSEESVFLYFLNGANLLKFCQKGAWPLLDWLNSKTSPCAMSSITSYCPALRGSWGGGYEGGVHLFTPRKACANRTRRGRPGRRGKTQSKETKEGKAESKEETSSITVMTSILGCNIKSCFHKNKHTDKTK